MKRLAVHETWWQNRPTTYDALKAQRGGPAAMDTIGLDLHKRESQLCVPTEAGEIVERQIVTSRKRFPAVLGGRAPAHILLEASTESEWVAQHLESLGHEVIVSDPNFAPMYATRRRGVKTEAPPFSGPPLRRHGDPSSYESANRGLSGTSRASVTAMATRKPGHQHRA